MTKRNLTWHFPAEIKAVTSHMEVISYEAEGLADDERWNGDYETAKRLARYVKAIERSIKALRKLETYCNEIVDTQTKN